MRRILREWSSLSLSEVSDSRVELGLMTFVGYHSSFFFFCFLKHRWSFTLQKRLCTILLDKHHLCLPVFPLHRQVSVSVFACCFVFQWHPFNMHAQLCVSIFSTRGMHKSVEIISIRLKHWLFAWNHFTEMHLIYPCLDPALWERVVQEGGGTFSFIFYSCCSI